MRTERYCRSRSWTRFAGEVILIVDATDLRCRALGVVGHAGAAPRVAGDAVAAALAVVEACAAGAGIVDPANLATQALGVVRHAGAIPSPGR